MLSRQVLSNRVFASSSAPRAAAIEFWRRCAYTLLIGVPTFCIVPGCGGDPPKPPPEAAGEDVDELQELVEGIELGSEVGTAVDPAGAASTPGVPGSGGTNP